MTVESSILAITQHVCKSLQDQNCITFLLSFPITLEQWNLARDLLTTQKLVKFQTKTRQKLNLAIEDLVNFFKKQDKLHEFSLTHLEFLPGLHPEILKCLNFGIANMMVSAKFLEIAQNQIESQVSPTIIEEQIEKKDSKDPPHTNQDTQVNNKTSTKITRTAPITTNSTASHLQIDLASQNNNEEPFIEVKPRKKSNKKPKETNSTAQQPKKTQPLKNFAKMTKKGTWEPEKPVTYPQQIYQRRIHLKTPPTVDEAEVASWVQNFEAHNNQAKVIHLTKTKNHSTFVICFQTNNQNWQKFIPKKVTWDYYYNKSMPKPYTERRPILQLFSPNVIASVDLETFKAKVTYVRGKPKYVDDNKYNVYDL